MTKKPGDAKDFGVRGIGTGSNGHGWGGWVGGWGGWELDTNTPTHTFFCQILQLFFTFMALPFFSNPPPCFWLCFSGLLPFFLFDACMIPRPSFSPNSILLFSNRFAFCCCCCCCCCMKSERFFCHLRGGREGGPKEKRNEMR